MIIGMPKKSRKATRATRKKSMKGRQSTEAASASASASVPVYNVFQPGLVRGSATLRHAPHKKYAYVEHPTEGWRVYLRSCSFIHDEDDPNPLKFLVVKATHKSPSSYAWEPPKGQMEGKDLPQKGPLLTALMQNAMREINEESGIPGEIPLKHTRLVFQDREKDYPPGHYFQYHIFRGAIKADIFDYAAHRFAYYREHPKEFKALVKDYREKDDIAWFEMKTHRLFGKWSPSIVMMYINSFLVNPKQQLPSS
jgi:8-oxo-dGTP pyrophosphatase MutT (NUDIX family)